MRNAFLQVFFAASVIGAYAQTQAADTPESVSQAFSAAKIVPDSALLSRRTDSSCLC